MRLILLRHGQTTSNVGNHLDTAPPGADLTELGRQQAAALPAALAGTGIEAVYASDLARARQTAAPLAEALGLAVQVRPGLREVAAGELEMANDPDSLRRYVMTIFTWPDRGLGTGLPGGETGAEVLARFDEVVAEVRASGVATAALVSHGAVIRAWVAMRADNVTAEYAARRPITNTGAVVVASAPTGWTVEDWEGHALGGPAVDHPEADGTAGDAVVLR
ncbi:histidine phosphatase family protein [Georgenia sp. TF02-10]|uniref:histidine phosphatase family protein n=1 Tax=Georgenia sp. TF02-10 TaxID=2917725 RepID=UPI001FA7E944|nr:histidine phosphatase family protein [Georgenia sp. TF02-10]UNX53451.1 histidine phosphatase family protein [Georgenia sp. TF02-10]